MKHSSISCQTALGHTLLREKWDILSNFTNLRQNQPSRTWAGCILLCHWPSDSFLVPIMALAENTCKYILTSSVIALIDALRKVTFTKALSAPAFTLLP